MATRYTPAKSYSQCDDLWIVTTFFNPFHYSIRLENYLRFADIIKSSGLHLLTVECAFGEDKFELPDDGNVLQIHARDLMWQRERLLNLGVNTLPENVGKIAWVDAELLFTNQDWAVETSAMLDVFNAVQPFQKIILLGPAASEGTDKDQSVPGFGYQQMLDADNVKQMGMALHGHTGYAWAFRREIIDTHGLYDAHIGGDGDHLMAHAMCGDFNNPCVTRVFITTPLEQRPHFNSHPAVKFCKRMLPAGIRRSLALSTGFNKVNSVFQDHFLNWAQGFFDDIRGRVGAVPGTILHLWHGNLEYREYKERRDILKSQNFNPRSDLRLAENGCWEWNSDKPELHTWIREHFRRRREDDVSTDKHSIHMVQL